MPTTRSSDGYGAVYPVDFIGPAFLGSPPIIRAGNRGLGREPVSLRLEV